MIRVLTAALCVLCAGCPRESTDPAVGSAASPRPLVFKNQPLWGDPAPFRALLDGFEREHPDVEVVHRAAAQRVGRGAPVLPHRAGGRRARLRRAGGRRRLGARVRARRLDCGPLRAPSRRSAARATSSPGPAEAVVVEGRTCAVPWYVDVGLLYYRTDLVPRAPRTYDGAASASRREAMATRPGARRLRVAGAAVRGARAATSYEAIWGHGGEALDADGRRAARHARGARRRSRYLRGLLARGRLAAVGDLARPRRSRAASFQAGRAVFMRNWPYAWAEAQKRGLARPRARSGIAPLPTRERRARARARSAAGSWRSTRTLARSARAAAAALIAHLTSPEANVRAGAAYARNPPRRAAYDDPRAARRRRRSSRSCCRCVERARPRPVTPYYTLISRRAAGRVLRGGLGHAAARGGARARAGAGRTT